MICVDALQAGECLRVRTPTATYHLVMCGALVASVYRQGDGEHHAILLEKRRMSNRIEVGQGFMMFDVDNNPVSSIIVKEVCKVSPNSIPLR